MAHYRCSAWTSSCRGRAPNFSSPISSCRLNCYLCHMCISLGITPDPSRLPNYYKLIPRPIATLFEYIVTFGTIAAIGWVAVWSIETASERGFEFPRVLEDLPGLIRLPLGALYLIVAFFVATFPWSEIVVGGWLLLNALGALYTRIKPQGDLSRADTADRSPRTTRRKESSRRTTRWNRHSRTVESVTRAASELGLKVRYNTVFDTGCWLLFHLEGSIAAQSEAIRSLDQRLHEDGYCIHDKSGGTLYIAPRQSDT